MFRKIISYILKRLGGKIKFQKYFEYLHSVSIAGMNYGNGGDFRISGENFAANYVKSKLTNQKRKLIIFDVGANTGQYSIELNSIFLKEESNIYSFEPSKKTFEVLKQNTENIKNISVFNFGFGEKVEMQKLFTNESLSGLASVYKRNLTHLGINMSATEEIEIQSIDTFCQNKNITEIDFLKLDVEGHELSCLLGAKKMLAENKIKFIQFEFGGCNIDSRTYFQDFWYLLNDHYNFYRIVKNGLHPITNYKETLEIFTTINYLLELKK